MQFLRLSFTKGGNRATYITLVVAVYQYIFVIV